jgi:predicted nucleic acid-binding protein
MDSSGQIFLDANVFVYFFDETSELHDDAVSKLEHLSHTDGAGFYTSHHVVEEVLFAASRFLSGKHEVERLAERLTAMPNVNLVEPLAELAFVERYVALWGKAKCGLNDALLLQIMLDRCISKVFSYDVALLSQAQKLGLEDVSAAAVD